MRNKKSTGHIESQTMWAIWFPGRRSFLGKSAGMYGRASVYTKALVYAETFISQAEASAAVNSLYSRQLCRRRFQLIKLVTFMERMPVEEVKDWGSYDE